MVAFLETLLIPFFFFNRHMRTHTRYELQESTSIEEASANADADHSVDSPHPGSFGSGAGPSRSISSESENIPQPVLQRQQPLNKPPSPMDTDKGKIESR